MKETILKIDLDLKSKNKCITHLKERLDFMNKIAIIDYKWISKIVLIKKDSYSAKIFINKEISEQIYIIIFQSILGDDWKRVGISFRDCCLEMDNWNRLFDIKRYPDGEYKFAKYEDITKDILK